MARWSEAVRFQVLDLTDPQQALFVKPGFYWLIPLDREYPAQAQAGLPDDAPINMIGPFDTREAAREDALAWIHAALTAPEPLRIAA